MKTSIRKTMKNIAAIVKKETKNRQKNINEKHSKKRIHIFEKLVASVVPSRT